MCNAHFDLFLCRLLKNEEDISFLKPKFVLEVLNVSSCRSFIERIINVLGNQR